MHVAADVLQTISVVIQLAHSQCLDTQLQQSTSLTVLRCQIIIKCMRLNSMNGPTQKECLGRNSEANFTYQIKENIWSGRGKASRFDHGEASSRVMPSRNKKFRSSEFLSLK